MSQKHFYIIAAIIGTLGPWYFFSGFVAEHGLDLGAFFTAGFSNDAAAGAHVDLLLSALVFWVWSFCDARQNAVKNWWLVIPSALSVGLSLALPLYLILRFKSTEPQTAQEAS